MGWLRDLARRSLTVRAVVVQGSVDDAIERMAALPVGGGPAPPSRGTVQVRYAGWLVDDGEPEVRVGDTWAPTLQLQRHEGGSPTDWFPLVEPAPAESEVTLTLLEAAGTPATYTFVGDVALARPSLTADWAAVDVGGLRFAVPGVHQGRVRGVGYLEHDTHMIASQDIIEAVSVPLRVMRIQALRQVHEREAAGGVVLLAGHAAPVDVAATSDALPHGPAGDHTFFIDLRLPRVSR